VFRVDPEQSIKEGAREVGESRKGAAKKAVEELRPGESHERVHGDPKPSGTGAVEEVEEDS
jgi:hypothetical protein